MVGFRKSKSVTIDADSEIERAEAARIEGESGPSELGSQRRPAQAGARTFMILLLVVILAIFGTFSYKAFQVTNAADEEEVQEQTVVRQSIPSYTPRPIEPEPSPEPQQQRTNTSTPQVRETGPTIVYRDAPVQEDTGPTQEELIRQRMLSSGLGGVGSNGGGQRASPASQQSAGVFGNDGGGEGELAEKLQPLRSTSSSAGVIANRDLVVTQGTMLDCVLDTRIVTTQPGMTSCYLTRDVYSTSGRVVLLDKGSKVVGFYQGGITQGQARIFVQWSRVETPQGVVINLDSPGTGPLGEAGVGGYIDRQFWARFGGSLLISMIGDLGEYVANRNNDNGQTLTLENTREGAQDAATEALKNSINIPPVLYKNQGERVAIFVARDLDFSDVYSLETK